MKRYLLWSIVILLAGAPVQAQAPEGKVVKETWDAAYLEGAKTGFFHTTVREIERDGKKLFVSTLEMSLTVKRYGSVVTLRLETGTEETADGKVVRVFFTQFLDKGKQSLTGRVEGDKLLVKIGTNAPEQPFPWDDKVVGLYKQDQQMRDKKLKPGDKLELINYELSLLSPVKVQVAVKNEEETDALVPPQDEKGTAERVRRKLLRTEAIPGKIVVGGKSIQLPKLVSWLDAEREPVRSQMELPVLGQITMYRTTEAVARKEGIAPALMPDLGLNTLIKLAKPIEKVNDARSIVYKITIKDEEDPKTIFTHDTRQEVLASKDNSVELQVKAFKNADVGEKPGDVKEEFQKSSFFLDSDNPAVKERAAKIVGEEADALKKAQRIEKWVHQNMKSSSAIGYVTASQINRDLRGDCRQHAMLSAALCRAAGVPVRTALGLVYVNDDKEGPVLGFHMWTEVWIKGNWLPLDATLGLGGIGAGHLKISDHSWTDTQTLAPLLPVIRAMGKIKVEVLKVE